jgi:hypothetical protein
MKILNLKIGVFLVICMTYFTVLSAQKKLSVKNNVSIAVSGTSTMHDWVMNSNAADVSLTLHEDDQGILTKISDMQFKMSAKSLKSGKNAMDNNAYKALKTDKFPHIVAKLKNATVTTNDNKNYTVKAKISLNIAGVEKESDLHVNIKKINMDAYEIKTSAQITMTDYNVSPPSFMMGAVKTGNDVTLNINFNIQ